MTRKRCKVCGQLVAFGYSWQPCGPSDSSRDNFAYPGWHYRGFPVVFICEDCKERIERGDTVTFEYHKQQFKLEGNEISKVEG
jgi:hypothetical protein